MINKLLTAFLTPYQGKCLASREFTLSTLIDFMNGEGKKLTKRLTSMEVAATIIAYNLHRRSTIFVNETTTNSIELRCRQILKDVRQPCSFRTLLNRHYLHESTADYIESADRKEAMLFDLTVKLEQSRNDLEFCASRTNLFTESQLGILNNKGLNKRLVDKYLRKGILDILNREYPYMHFDRRAPIASLFRKITAKPRDDDNDFYLQQVEKCAALTEQLAR